MHKNFYAGGFLFHPLSKQILLQQKKAGSNTLLRWLLFGGVSVNQNAPEEIFKDIIFKLLDIKIENVSLVYSYKKENIDLNQHIVYSEIDDLKDFPSKNGRSFAWFTFKEAQKLPASEQTKHDIVVGQRVIEAETRKRLGLHTFQ